MFVRQAKDSSNNSNSSRREIGDRKISLFKFRGKVEQRYVINCPSRSLRTGDPRTAGSSRRVCSLKCFLFSSTLQLVRSSLITDARYRSCARWLRAGKGKGERLRSEVPIPWIFSFQKICNCDSNPSRVEPYCDVPFAHSLWSVINKYRKQTKLDCNAVDKEYKIT